MQYIFIFTFIFLAKFLSAQTLDSTIRVYAEKYGQERAYLQYDKSVYAPGETIWFKVYLMTGLSPAEESKTFYTDWTDDKGNLLFRIAGPIVNGTTNGQLDIPADYSGQYIHVRGYTKWMLNFDSAFLYNKDIRIITKKTGPPVKNDIISFLQFFPEGGDAVMKVTNKIAFKATDQWGRPVNIKGIIQNNQGKFIDSLRILHDGMGYFFITPQPGESFMAKWKDEKGMEKITSLPAVTNEGVSLQVKLAGTKREFSITATPDIMARSGKVHLVGTMYQQEVFKTTKDISTGIAKGIIPTAELPSGILTITVFDDKWKPLAERITYINNGEYLFQTTLAVQHWGLNKRARNEIEISVPDSLQASLAVSVTDADIEKDSSETIISHLLMTGDLKGQVYNPAYYFSHSGDSISQQLDLVMLTNGWRRFNWEEMASGKFPSIRFSKDTAYLTLSGKIYGALPSDLRQGGNIILLISRKNAESKIIALPILPDGSFNDPSYLFLDTLHVYYQLPKKKFGDASVRFMENLLPPLRYNIPASGYFVSHAMDTSGNSRHYQLADELNRLLQQYEGKMLGNVTIKTRAKSPLEVMDQKYTSGMFAGGDSYQFDLVNDNFASSSIDIFHYLQGKVAGLQINTSNNPPTLQWRGGSPGLYVDEMQTDADLVSAIPVTDIAYVKIFRPPFMGSMGGSNGAIAIYTRRGDDVKPTPGKGLSNNQVRGYTAIRQFYSPDYSSFKPENEKKDLRTTLYWNPQVNTSPGKNKITLTFYNNDVSRAFRVVIEGMTRDGQLTRLEQIME
jgi:hypothetical protein